MLGPAAKSPATRRIADLQARVSRLEAFEAWRPPVQFDFEAAVGPEMWG
jgi:hypothetical protein